MKRPPKLNRIIRYKRRFTRYRAPVLNEIQKECTCTITYSGKEQYINYVGCPVHWKELTM